MDRLGRASLTSLPADIAVPSYLDREISVGIVHFGVGNFHRAHQAMYIDRLLQVGTADEWAICGIGLFDRDARMRDALVEQDGLYTLALRHPDGNDEISVVGSIRRFLHAPDDPDAVLDQLTDPGVRIVSLTITEGGYVEDATDGKRAADDPNVVAEAANGLSAPLTAFGWIVAALRERRRRGIPPFTVLSCDNVPGNGTVARRSVEAVARMVAPELADWIAAEVSFPSTMVDRITPVTVDADVDRIRDRAAFVDAWPVAAEPFEQWIIEDDFPAGRPDFAAAGATVVADVHAYEAIKIRLLNGGHQAVAYIGQLAGYRYVHEALGDPRIAAFVRSYMEQDAAPTLAVPEGFDVPGYIDELFHRFANPAIADTLTRLGTDASNRIPKFVVPALRDRLAAGETPRAGARLIASWREFNRQAGAGAFTLDDESAHVLMESAADPRRFLLALPTLAPLADAPAFVEAYLAACRIIAQEGVDAVLGS
ncbi:mannitol dehydrogenase family protein [Microbacterium sp. YMB-B2]|uniref:Mannitol-1-phosphate 5-dehydrogenase n=1 Tax=Microbacterium tenebrionis TaxID=2830665 RepID=A0A9X1LLX3_9MICO|nr:mannitol dehydrogenase family protein [Microbacterium tenebrionis]MCC2028073.1 mannitol dehydrogenase family protein [Microbacterium tenebrionis]